MPRPVSAADRWLRIAFLLLALLQSSIFWVFPYYPTQDGPSHLHNAAVLANYGSEAIYRQYYTLAPLNPAGNLTTQYLLAAFFKVAGAALAEKLLLTGYVLLFFFSFRYLVKAIADKEDFSLFAGLMVSNYFLEMGFWNYIYSVCLMMWMAGYYVRRRGRWTAGSLTLFCVAGMVLYLSHAVSWMVGVAAAGVLGLPLLFTALKARDWSGFRQYAMPVVALLPPAGLVLLQFAHAAQSTAAAATEPVSLREHLWPLYSFSFMHAMGGRLLYAKALEAIFALLTAGAMLLIWREAPRRWRAPEVLMCSLTCVLLVLIGPDTIGSGLFIHKRLVFCACIFLAAWLAAQNWPTAARRTLPALFFGLSIVFIATRIPTLARWNQRIADFMGLQEVIRPRSSVLWLDLQQLEAGPDPYGNPVGMLAEKAVIDMRNYEASADLFISRFRPEHSPFPTLGTVYGMAEAPPKFDIEAYERATHDRVDYLIFQGLEPGEAQRFPTQLANYTLVSTSRGGGLRLYEHKPGHPPAAPSTGK